MQRDHGIQGNDRDTTQNCTVTNHRVTSQREPGQRRLKMNKRDRLKTKAFPFLLSMALVSESKATVLERPGLTHMRSWVTRFPVEIRACFHSVAQLSPEVWLESPSSCLSSRVSWHEVVISKHLCSKLTLKPRLFGKGVCV